MIWRAISGQQVSSRAETDSALESAPEYVLEYVLGLLRFRFRIRLFSPKELVPAIEPAPVLESAPRVESALKFVPYLL